MIDRLVDRRIAPPPAVPLHRPGGGDEPLRDRLEIGVGVIQAEDQAAGADPAQRQPFGAKVVLQHPVVARRPRVADGPDRGHVRHLHRQRFVAQVLVEPLRPAVPQLVEVAIKRLGLRRFQVLQELVHRPHHHGMRVERAAGKADVGRPVVAKPLHQVLAAADHADRKSAADGLAVGHEVGPDAEVFLRAAEARGESRRTPRRRSTRYSARCRPPAGA